MYDPSTHPFGVPNPYVPNVQEYPSPQHGGDWTRPVFGLPWVRTPYNVPGPPSNMYGIGQLETREPISPYGAGLIGAAAVAAITFVGSEIAMSSSGWTVGERERDAVKMATGVAAASAFFAVALAVSLSRGAA